MPKLTDKELDLLKALPAPGAQQPASLSAFARDLGRDKGTVRASIAKLIELDLVEDAMPVPVRSDLGRRTIEAGGEIPISDEAAALVAAAVGQAAPPAAPAADVVGILHRLIFRSELNPRKDFDSEQALEALAELADSIAENGLMQNLVVRRDAEPGLAPISDAPTYTIVAGERRWRAIGRLILDGRWPGERPIPCQVREVDDRQHATLALVENLQRRDLKPLEEARQIKAVIEATELGTAEIAQLIGLSQRWVQQRLQLLDLPPIKQVELEAGKITIEQARQAIANLPKLREDLEPADWLLMLEVFDKVTLCPFEGASYTECGKPDEADAARIQRLATYPTYLIGNVYEHMVDGWADGRRHIGLGYSTSDLKLQLGLRFGDDVLKSAEFRAIALKDLRAEVLGLQVAAALPLGAYGRAWLNGPFERDAELIAEGERAKAKQEAGDARRRAEQDEAKAKAAAAWARTEALVAQLRQQRADLAATGRTINGGPIDAPIAGFADAQAELSRPLPWTICPRNADLRDAAGEVAIRSGFDPYGSGNPPPPHTLARQTLLGTAVNAAGGFGPPEPYVKPTEVLAQGAFLDVVADALGQDCADLGELFDADPEDAQAKALERATAGLAAWLDREGTSYGHADYVWDHDAALEVAATIREDRLGYPDEDEPSEALVALAEGRAGEIAEAEA